MLDASARHALVRVLERGRDRGLLGPGPVEAHIEHALVFAPPIGSLLKQAGEDGRAVVDLGTGGGVPGLVLALAFPASRWLLVDGRRRSTVFVEEAVRELGIDDRVAVETARAEELGRDPTHRGRHPAVVSRGFGPPAATAECAAPMLEVGGRLVVSEPPGAVGERWRAEGLGHLGLDYDGLSRSDDGTVAVLVQVRPCPDRYPRRVGIPVKRPLFPSNADPDVSRETRPGT